MAKRTSKPKGEKKIEVHYCYECEYCTPETRIHLNWKGEPILRGCLHDGFLNFIDSVACKNFKSKNQ